jgi:hypothetical protein
MMTGIRHDAAFRALIVATVLAALALLVGCAEGNKLGASKQAEGIVYDGYLSGAKVCVDQVVNRQCDDPPEPATFTDLQGNFSLLGLTPEQARFPIVAEVVAGTIDLDTGLPAPAGLKYLAPAGSTAISAFSTIIQIRIEQQIAAGLSTVPIVVPGLATLKATVTADLATELGLPAGTDLTRYDPIAAKNNTSLSAADRLLAAKLHIVSRILSAQIAQFLPLAEANAEPGKDSAAYAALLANLDVAQALVDLEAYITANTLTLNDLLDPSFDPSLVPVADPAVPSTAEINVQFETDANVLQAITDLINGDPPATGAGGGTP